MSRGGQSDARSQAQHERKFAGYRYVYCESRQILECELRLCGMPLGLVLRLLPANDPFLYVCRKLPRLCAFGRKTTFSLPQLCVQRCVLPVGGISKPRTTPMMQRLDGLCACVGSKLSRHSMRMRLPGGSTNAVQTESDEPKLTSTMSYLQLPHKGCRLRP